MNDFELYTVTRQRLEVLWREAEHRARIFAAHGELAADGETALARHAGARA